MTASSTASTSTLTPGGINVAEKRATSLPSLFSRISTFRDHRLHHHRGRRHEADGHVTLIASESFILNDNRNPGQTRTQIEAELSRTLARFMRPGAVLFVNSREQPGDDGSKEDAAWIAGQREARRSLSAATDAHGRPLEGFGCVGAAADNAAGYRAVFSYANYLQVDGGVLLSQFDDEETDAAALETVRKAFLREKYDGECAGRHA
ncbi:peptidylarginine deiminase-like enzyme [Akanthomyces lecanii RCEF 1005]|uniref:Peptidylarginine deiminase-like enzyme n=1 Tax=Akanthomyces lecanii RCEF 1005 TaxID=1081108 RepID=A0A162KTY2_CORDF|nr:peptidylarginine deiminase-like enzyme [Akanthomyces lecanii RCEF 1005]